MTDTGPPYPRSTTSSAIGEFAIGVSPIGGGVAGAYGVLFDFWETIISQYANSPRLIALIESFVDAVDPTMKFEQFFDLIWNVDTAQGYGLDVWGRIVGINRVLQVSTGSWFGFEEAGDAEGFNVAPFWGGDRSTENYRLDDETYRRLIIAKAMANISDGSIPSINAILRYLFPYRGGNAYVNDGRSYVYFGFEEARNTYGFNHAPFYSGQTIPVMTIDYVFEFPLTALDYAIIGSGVLPKPSGVKAGILVNV